MHIQKIGNEDVITCLKATSIRDAAKLMKKKNIGDVVVVESEVHKIPVGIITDRDIALAIADSDVAGDTKVEDVMSRDVLVLDCKQSTHQTLEMMQSRKVRRAPIVDDEGKVCGIVTLDDLIALMAKEMHILASLICKQAE